MDPIPDFPTATSHQSPPMSHPPYAEMIIAAITALKDKDGSSKQAISNYIEKKFTPLPPTHPTLLTHHLNRLKNLGQLVMVKHSYMLPPTSGQFQSTDGYHPTIDFIGTADANVDTVGVNLGDPPSGLSKRKPGRPPKLKPVSGLGLQNQVPNVQGCNVDVASYQYQVGVGEGVDVNYGSGSGFQGDSGGGSEPLFAALGLGDDGGMVEPSPVAENTPVVVKRGRGRPPKSTGGKVGGFGGHVAGSGGGDGEGEIQTNVAGSDGGGEVQGGEAGVRKPEVTSVGDNAVRVKRGRGRPRRFGIGAVTVPLSGNLLRPRGRAKRVARPKVAINRGAGEGVLGLRRRGRPPRNMTANLTGESLSRPNEDGHGTAVLVTDPQQLVVYQELKTKYEHLQSKVKQVASVVKSCIDPHYGNTALGALQELEDLAGEVGAPSHGSNP